MNCQEAQSKIQQYINDSLSQTETKEFIHHVRNCRNCRDELEIHYILSVGMQQLDEGEVLSADFQKELEDNIHRRYEKIVKEESWQRSFHVVLFSSIFSFFLWILGECINQLL